MITQGGATPAPDCLLWLSGEGYFLRPARRGAAGAHDGRVVRQYDYTASQQAQDTVRAALEARNE